MDRFCIKCGTELVDGVCPKCAQLQIIPKNTYDDMFKNLFMSPNEKVVAVLGKSNLERFFHSGKIENGFIVASDKRIYLQGKKYYVGEDGEIEENNNSRIVDLRDVTGTGFDSFVDNGWLYLGIANCVIAVLLLVIVIGIFVGIFAAYCFYKYYKSKHSFIVIQYAGGEIGYEVKWFGKQEIELFQKQLRLAKDKIIEKEDIRGAHESSNRPQSSKADELLKLSDLLTRGAITQEEFDKIKKELIL